MAENTNIRVTIGTIETANNVFDAAERRVNETPELQPYRDVIFAGWVEGIEHLDWVATAPVAEIVDWAQGIAEATQNEWDATGVDPTRAV